jgi:hypothetical protein
MECLQNLKNLMDAGRNIHSSLVTKGSVCIGFFENIISARDDDLMQQELKNVLTIFREKRKIEIQRTPEVYVNQHSTEAEVQEWLKQKGFSDRIRKQLAGMNGNELFSLKRSQIENYCGKEEGRRLDSQITISRNTTGVI